MTMVPVADGELEFVPSPDHVNVIVETDEGVEVRLTEGERDRLAKAMREDVEENVELESGEGVIAWEPNKGLYVEDYDGPDMWVILSPEERERAAEALRETPVGP